MLCFFWVVSQALQSMNCNLRGSSVHGILQARILKWVAMPSYRASSNPEIELRSPASQGDSLPSEPQRKPYQIVCKYFLSYPFYFVECFLCCAAFWSDIIPLVYFILKLVFTGVYCGWDELGVRGWHTYAIDTVYRIDNQWEPVA